MGLRSTVEELAGIDDWPAQREILVQLVAFAGELDLACTHAVARAALILGDELAAVDSAVLISH